MYTATANSFNSYRLLGVAYFNQCIISKEITHTIKPLPVQPKMRMCVCVFVRVRIHTHMHNDTVDCSDYTAVNLSPRKQMLRHVPDLSTYLPCTCFSKIFSFKSHCKTIPVLQLPNMNLILNQLAKFHMTGLSGQMWPNCALPKSRAVTATSMEAPYSKMRSQTTSMNRLTATLVMPSLTLFQNPLFIFNKIRPCLGSLASYSGGPGPDSIPCQSMWHLW